MPGKAAHILAWILTILLMLSLTAFCLTWQVNRMLTSPSLHESVALDRVVQQEQMARIEATVQELAQRYSFKPETVMNIVTGESVAQYNRDVVAWWMGLMGEEPVIDAPVWPTRGVEQAVREDELFKENTPTDVRRTTARDKIAYQVGQAVQKTVLPVRADILSLLMPKVLEKIDLPVYVHYASLLPLLCGVASAVLALMLLLVMLKRISKAALYIGTALGASGLCALGLCGVFSLLGISGMVGEISSLLAMQLDILAGKVYLQVGIYAAIALALGLGLIGLHQADIRSLVRRRRCSEA